MAKKCLMIYDRKHTPLAEIDDYCDDLKYGWTLNDVDTLNVSLALSSKKCTKVNTQFGNHIELVDSSTGTAVWGGIICGQSFRDAKLELNCYDYNYLLKNRRLQPKTYGPIKYGALMQQMIADCEAARPDYPTGIDGYNIAGGALQTTREVKNTDFLWAKIKEFGDDANYDYGVDTARTFNFWLRKGADKPQYILEWGGNRSNIIVCPTLARDICSLENSVYAETDGDTKKMTSSAEDKLSQQAYGLFEGTFSPNSGVSIQNTLDTQVNGELQRDSQPASSIELTIMDSTRCPFSDIEVGDRVTVHLIPYFDFSASVRILRMVHDEKQNTRELTVGNILFKPQLPTKRLYKG